MKTKSPFAVFSLVSVKQPVHVDICNWETFSTSASLHTVVHLMVRLVRAALDEGREVKWSGQWKLLNYYLLLKDKIGYGSCHPCHRWHRQGCTHGSGAAAGHQQGRMDMMKTRGATALWDCGLSALHQAWRLGDQQEWKLAVKMTLWHFAVSAFISSPCSQSFNWFGQSISPTGQGLTFQGGQGQQAVTCHWAALTKGAMDGHMGMCVYVCALHVCIAQWLKEAYTYIETHL